jgi:hypothetical protein
MMNYGKCLPPDKRRSAGRLATRPNAGFDLKAARTGIGAALKTLHSEVLREEVPDRMVELLTQLENQPTLRDQAGNATRPATREVADG